MLLAVTLGTVVSGSTSAAVAVVPRPGEPAPGTMSGDLTALGAEIFDGEAFDTCVAPPLDAMRDWLRSPYRAVGVYIGGRGRACKEQPHLTPGWVREVNAMGWRLLPLYVGSQSPCVRLENKRGVVMDSARPWDQGVEEARDAVASARGLGMTAGSPVYLDMEAYDHTDESCAATTLAFTRAFTREVREQGYIPGYYSSSTSGIAHLENARLAGVDDLPDVLWYARWQVPPTLHDEPVLAPYAWQPHRRIHQHAGDVYETHGGRRMHIDRNLVHAPVAIIR
ncbi:hypothetical protein GCM10009716_40110 [Streptomyces sodiiphilus]|uniref:Rv2525c-like glycoside hydrolase-like domain-containing protein n=1 Tax=Streptomyces sodiiphilus TaxID=226217 RepID=A0ABP5B2C5_9ACTN